MFLLGIFYSSFYSFFYKPPTCFDGKQNQTEQGVDCGFPCSSVCSFQTMEPVVLWSRVFKLTNDVYNAMALVENANSEAEAFGVPYSFKVYDDKNVLIYERIGKVDLLANSTVPIFERTIVTGERTPQRTFFEFSEEIKWEKAIKEQPDLFVKNKELSYDNGKPRLNVTIENQTLKSFNNIEITAIVFDKEGNAINVSQTIINSLPKSSSEDVVFTWSEPFVSEPGRTTIIPLVK